jgi:mannan endo-1,4-beta-mannosidase
MKSRIVIFLVIAAAVLTLAAATVLRLRAPGRPVAVHATLAATRGSYLGVYEPGSPPPFAEVATFGQAVGRMPNLAGYYSGWPVPFDTSFADVLRRHGIAVVVQMDPTDASVAGIAYGSYDSYLRSYADSVRKFGGPVVIGFGHEMNAGWYSWGYGHVRPAVFIAAWRHIVTVFRQQGADNVTWLWTVQGQVPGTGPVWSWWPGSKYVTWVGIDGYYYRPSDTFGAVFGTTIDQVRHLTDKPILLSETAVGPLAGQSAKIQDLFRGLAEAKTLGLIWFDIAQDDGIYHQDWRIEGSKTAQQAFRLGIQADPGLGAARR